MLTALQFPTLSQDVSVPTTLHALSALEALCDYALYKSTFTLQVFFYETALYKSTLNFLNSNDIPHC